MFVVGTMSSDGEQKTSDSEHQVLDNELQNAETEQKEPELEVGDKEEAKEIAPPTTVAEIIENEHAALMEKPITENNGFPPNVEVENESETVIDVAPPMSEEISENKDATEGIVPPTVELKNEGETVIDVAPPISEAISENKEATKGIAQHPTTVKATMENKRAKDGVPLTVEVDQENVMVIDVAQENEKATKGAPPTTVEPGNDGVPPTTENEPTTVEHAKD